jgi:hypothetical protein
MAAVLFEVSIRRGRGALNIRSASDDDASSRTGVAAPFPLTPLVQSASPRLPTSRIGVARF